MIPKSSISHQLLNNTNPLQLWQSSQFSSPVEAKQIPPPSKSRPKCPASKLLPQLANHVDSVTQQLGWKNRNDSTALLNATDGGVWWPPEDQVLCPRIRSTREAIYLGRCLGLEVSHRRLHVSPNRVGLGVGSELIFLCGGKARIRGCPLVSEFGMCRPSVWE